MQLDNVSFLIMWFLVMFITLSSGILIIMYRVGCFKCNHKIADLQTSLQKLIHPSSQQSQADAEAQPQPEVEKGPIPGTSQGPIPMQRVLVRQSTSEGPNKVCTVCGEPMEPDSEPGESSHPACRDMDVSFF